MLQDAKADKAPDLSGKPPTLFAMRQRCATRAIGQVFARGQMPDQRCTRACSPYPTRTPVSHVGRVTPDLNMQVRGSQSRRVRPRIKLAGVRMGAFAEAAGAGKRLGRGRGTVHLDQRRILRAGSQPTTDDKYAL